MSTFSSSAPIRVWIGPQSNLLTIPNSSGVWTTTGVKWLPHDSIDMGTHAELAEPKFHTGTGGLLAGILDRKGGNSIRGQFPIFPSGTAGTPPDSDLLLQGIFGQAQVAVSGVSNTYSPAFATLPFVMGRYNRIVNDATNHLAWGCIPTRVTFNLGGNGYFMAVAEIIACYVLNSDNFSNEDTAGKAGLTAFPVEPSGATANGDIIVPYNGPATFGGSSAVEFISADIEYITGASIRTGGFLSRYGFAAFPGTRQAALKSLKFADSDGATLQAVKNASVTKVPMNVIIVQNNVAGYTVTHTVKNVQFGDATFVDEGNALNCQFADSPAHVSSYTALDEYTLMFS